jgi:hypothetical protein
LKELTRVILLYVIMLLLSGSGLQNFIVTVTTITTTIMVM